MHKILLITIVLTIIIIIIYWYNYYNNIYTENLDNIKSDTNNIINNNDNLNNNNNSINNANFLTNNRTQKVDELFETAQTFENEEGREGLDICLEKCKGNCVEFGIHGKSFCFN